MKAVPDYTAKVTRLQVDLPPEARRRLEEVRERTEAASYSEVLKRALIIYEAVSKKQLEGKTFGYVDEGNIFHDVLII